MKRFATVRVEIVTVRVKIVAESRKP